MPRARKDGAAGAGARTLSVSQAVAEFGASRSTLYRLMDGGTLTWIGGGGKRRIPRASLEAWRQANTVRGRY